MRTAETIPVPGVGTAAKAASAVGISTKIQADHLQRLAVVYVRQSSPKQVLENRESTARQYAFADHAVALGWPRERVLTIDDDLAVEIKRRRGAAVPHSERL